MKYLILVFSVFVMASCGSKSNGNKKADIREGTMEQCDEIWSTVDYVTVNRGSGALSDSEVMGICHDMQQKFLGIKCTRTLKSTNGDTEVDELIIDHNFCQPFKR